MDDANERNKSGQFQKGCTPGPGRRRRQFTDAAQERAVSVLNNEGISRMIEALDATKLFGKEGIEHADWPARIKAFETLRDTFVGRPAQIITGEDGGPLRVDITRDLEQTLAKFAEGDENK